MIFWYVKRCSRTLRGGGVSLQLIFLPGQAEIVFDQVEHVALKAAMLRLGAFLCLLG